MKVKLFSILMMAMVLFVACEDESNEVCENPDAVCPDGTDIQASACCDEDDCYWVYKGNNYDCDGENCTSAINTIVADACVSGINLKSGSDNKDLEQLKAELAALTQKLLLEARACADCE